MLTAPWHERDTQRLVERLGLSVYTPLPDTAEYLMQTYGLGNTPHIARRRRVPAI